jgi:phosphohistidine phosphatase SixA
MLDGPHREALRGVARGIVEDGHAPAVRNLAVAGLVEPADGVWQLTQAGHAVLELEGGDADAGDQLSDIRTKLRDWFMT